MRRFGALLAVPLLLPAGAAQAQAPDAALLSGGCQGCHGVTGQAGHGVPTIARQHSRAEFVQIMQAFQANQRPATVMGRIARGYTEAEIAALAAHYARPE
ncbi:MAG TPA: hypothetical protein VD970_08755 [Acetobacteraceae bacterium]|nr:hypothetical protein [Acetobacteraceae bacterium]